MRMPNDCKLAVSSLTYEAMMRPKHFISLELECVTSGMKISRYVNSVFPLLFIRLWLARRQLIKSMRRYKIFAKAYGFSS